MPDLFDQLAEIDVPPPPVEFDRTLHDKLNRTLTSLHIADLFLKALPGAALHFARAVADALFLTLFGKHLPEKTNDNR